MHRRADNHHVFHERRWYVTDADKALREQRLFIPRLEYSYHHAGYPEGLHENLLPPPKPNHNMVLGALAVAQSFDTTMKHPEAIERIADWFDGLRNGSDLGQRIALNLYAQLEYIKLGYIPEVWHG